MRIELKHFIGVSDATIDAAALGRANSNASLVGGGGAVLTMEEATAWAPPAYPLVGDGLVFGASALAGMGLCPHDRVVVLRFSCLGQLEGVCGGSGAGVVT